MTTQSAKELVDGLEQELVDGTVEDTTPAKFRGKSFEDVVQSYVELEKEKGRKDQEVGELRKLTDQFIHQELNSKTHSAATAEEDVQVDFDDLVDNPKGAVDKVVQPQIQRLEDKLNKMERQSARTDFISKHPDYMDVGGNPEFNDWVSASNYRLTQFQAAQDFDFEAADALISEWKDRQSFLRSSGEKKQKEKTQQQLRDATVESGTTSSSSSGKKVYSRQEIINLKMYEPQKYAALESEIMRAYQEGRVK